MLINGVNITAFGAKLYDRVINSNTVDTKQEWLDGDIQPTFVRQQDGFKKIDLAFLILGTDEESAFVRMSRLTQALRKASLVFDDINLTFDVTLEGEGKPERLKNGNFIVRYTLKSDYAKGAREVYTTDARATSAFRLNVLYYLNSTTMVGQEVVTIRAGSFDVGTPTLSSIGIEVDKYNQPHYMSGVASNLGAMELTYENLQALGTLIINYAPVQYNLNVAYFINSGEGYQETLNETIQFTYPQLQRARTIGNIIDANLYRPDGYRATINYSGELTVESLLGASPIQVLYDVVANEQSKNVTVIYRKENDEGTYDILNSAMVYVRETNIVDGVTLGDIINTNGYNPDSMYYYDGAIEGYNLDDLITYADVNPSYYVNYRRKENIIYVEYYAGTYPDWYRLTSIPVTTKYKDAYETSFDIDDAGIDLDKYHTAEYARGVLYNAGSFESYADIVTAGVLQVYYVPIDFPLTVRYKTDDSNEYTDESITINALQFFGDPVLSDIVDVTLHRPEGYQLDLEESYSGEISLGALTSSSPIYIVYEEIQQVRTKNIIVRYKQELASAYSTINTSLLTINESDCVGGVRLRDIINMNLYRPQYYDAGTLNGASENALLNYEDILSNYEVLYRASTYMTPVNYYTDDIDVLNLIGSSVISYKVIDFTAETTLYTLGLNLNAYKPSYSGDGTVDYHGEITFSALRNLEAINVVYESVQEPDDPSGIDYPHRFLFLQHNDLGSYEHEHPEWTMNHAYINTGVSVADMSKLTVIMECKRVDDYVAPHTVNAGYAYLFGSSSALGQYYMRFNNQTMYGTNLTGVNTYEAKAGSTVNQLVLTEENAIGWSTNSGIYSTANYNGYSTATFTYSSRMPTEHAQMPYPLYLFANNNNGEYADGLAGWGIYGCKILYDGNLIRDFIPVQFYDKIGDQVAPSNCLYDKVSQTFFEDATGLNSFNIIDDDRYEDLNPEHKIGSFYVNYYKGDTLFQTTQIYFRGNDFDEEWNFYEKLLVDEFQPAYYRPGTITNLNEMVAINFDNVNNFVFRVVYQAEENQFQVNYYKDSIAPENLIETDTIALHESDFYQVPTFGDIVRLNKYRPNGYKTEFEYPGAKVSLQRVMDNAPYNILYVPAGEEESYTTSIKYMKKVFGIRTYEVLGTVTLTLTESQFRDGEYIENFIDFNAMKPANYYKDGEPYQWYKHDIRLDDPDNLLDEYIVYYLPAPQNVEIRYYTDEVDEANLVATTNWTVQLDEFDGEFYVTDLLPNSYINKFKPVTADGGILQDSDVLYTFTSLMAQGHIDILYMSIAEPDDPTNVSRIGKMLYWTGEEARRVSWTNGKGVTQYHINGGAIPYIDLGYTPKEIGRLKVEMKAYMKTDGFFTTTTDYGYQASDYTYGFGYYGALGTPVLNSLNGKQDTMVKEGVQISYNEFVPNESLTSSGAFALRGHIPQADRGTYTDAGLVSIDGNRWYSSSHQGTGIQITLNSIPSAQYEAIYGTYRKGNAEGQDENYNYYRANSDYTYGYRIDLDDYVRQNAIVNDKEETGHFQDKFVANPITYTLDAYHSYASAYDFGNSNTLVYTNFDESNDENAFEDRCRPQGSLTLFRTRNPDTGNINLMPFTPKTYPRIDGGLGMVGFTNAEIRQMINPFADDFTGSVVRRVLVAISGGDASQETAGETVAIGSKTYKYVDTYRSVEYSDFPCPVYPQIDFMAVWSIKIWDQDRLVRDLIPVKAGERIYDYVMPADGLFDLVTEIFFGNSNLGGTYTSTYFITTDSLSGTKGMATETVTISPEDVAPLHCVDDPCYWGKITENYYDENNHFIANQYVDVPTWFNPNNTTLADTLQYNDYKPDDYHLDGMIDTDDPDDPHLTWGLADIYEQGSINVYYKLRTYAKSVVYYQDNFRIGSRDIFFSLADIENANSLSDLNIDANFYQTPEFQPGRLVFNASLLQNDDVAGFIDAPSPIVVYDKYTKFEHPEYLYLEYYRGGAYDDPNAQITLDSNDVNYFNCNLDAVVLNPNGAIKYRNHYHSALYEDEEVPYFVSYQVRVINPYVGIHYGPARKYKTLAQIIESDTYTIVEERNGWGRLREYYHGWIPLDATVPMTGPGQNPDYDTPDAQTATLPFATHITITRLTVDRLWAWVPAEESWIKTEDISYDQAGKLYNAIGLDVIDLDDVDWTNVTTYADIGIAPDKKRLRYHNASGFTYDGALTQSAFSNLHTIDFVYPETIYNYNCIYYQGHKDDNNELGRTAFSCTISDWNPDWDHFIETSWRVDDNQIEIAPELYRGAPISLSWDYFGFGRNTYKPTGYYDGIYLWNPHPWDDEHLFFSFEELVKTGTQYVVYPFFNPHAYKYWHMPRQKAVSGMGYIYTDQTHIAYETNNKYADLVFEVDTPMKRVSTSNSRRMSFNDGNIKLPVGQMMAETSSSPFYLRGRFYMNLQQRPYTLANDNNGTNRQSFIFDEELQDLSVNDANADYYLSVWELRKELGLTNFLKEEPNGYYRFYASATQPYGDFFISKVPYHNEYAPRYGVFTLYSDEGVNTNSAGMNIAEITSQHVSFYNKKHNMVAITNSDITNDSFKQYIDIPAGVIHAIKAYNANGGLAHYFVAVPKGMWYEWDGVQAQISDNGMFDLLTGDLVVDNPGCIFRYDFRTTEGQEPYDMRFDYFEGWQYEETPMTYQLYQVGSTVPLYAQPDALSPIVKSSLPSGSYAPVDKRTNDANSRVQGTWYHTANGWFNATATARSVTGLTLTKQKQTVAVIWATGNTYRNDYDTSPTPLVADATTNTISETSPSIKAQFLITIYDIATVNDVTWLWDGSVWYKMDHTSMAHETANEEYVVVNPNINVYQYPIANDDYIVSHYYSGDRVFIPYRSSRNTAWLYTGTGWIFNDGSNLEIVE